MKEKIIMERYDTFPKLCLSRYMVRFFDLGEVKVDIFLSGALYKSYTRKVYASLSWGWREKPEIHIFIDPVYWVNKDNPINLKGLTSCFGESSRRAILKDKREEHFLWVLGMEGKTSQEFFNYLKEIEKSIKDFMEEFEMSLIENEGPWKYDWEYTEGFH